MCHQECHQRSADRLLQLCAVNGGVFVKVGGLRTDFNKNFLERKDYCFRGFESHQKLKISCSHCLILQCILVTLPTISVRSSFL